MTAQLWTKVEKINVSSLSEEQADELFELLKNAQLEADLEMAKVKKIFEVTKAVMVNRHQLLEDAMNEAEAEAKQASRKEQEMKKDLERAQKEIEELKKFGPEGGTTRDARFLREQMRELEETNDQLKQEIKDLNRDLSGEKRAAEKYSERISELERELKETREENDQMRQDISDYKMQMQTQRDNIVSRRGEDVEFKEKMTKKNKELAEALEELQNLTDANDLLQKRCEDLQTVLEGTIVEMDRTREDYLKLKNILQQSDTVTDALREENEILKNQVQDLTEQVQSKGEADDAIMAAVNQKIDEWQEIMQEKDVQIAALQEQHFRHKEQLIAVNMDSDKATVSALSEVLKDKDKQIAELTDRVSQYTAEMEKNAAIIEDLNSELHKAAGSSYGDRLQNKIKELQTENRNLRETRKQLEEDIHKAEEDCRSKDKQLSEVLERMRQYEAGEYGLSEAVAEIKGVKGQVQVREREIEEMTKYINKVEMRINEVLDENEELRYKLGMDPKEPLDLTEFRKNKAIRHEELKAVNFTLQREIEMLEEERIEDKKKIRKLAQQLGQRAVALGLGAEDLLAVQDYTETLKEKRRKEETQQSAAFLIREQVQKEEKYLLGKELDKDFKENVKELHKLEQEVMQLRADNQQLGKDNDMLEAGFKEVMQAMQKVSSPEGKAGSVSSLQFPSVEKMLAAIEAKKVLGSYDTTYFLKEQVDVLRGRNEELKNVLREIRVEVTKVTLERDKAFERLERLEKDNFLSSDPNTGVALMFGGMRLPEGLAPTSSDLIGSLTEHLTIVLQELSQRESLLKQVETSLDNYKRKFAVLRHQQGLLYQEYLQEKKEWQDEKNKMNNQLQDLQDQKEADMIHKQEFNRLVETLAQDDVEVRRRLSEMTRRITVLRVNEKALVRRHNTMEEIEAQLRREVTHLRNEMNQMEEAVSKRLGYLQRYKDMAAFKIAGLQKSLEESVPVSDFDKVTKEYQNLTEKYRDMLEKGNNLVTKAEKLEQLKTELKQLTENNMDLKKTLEMEKEKLHTLEALMEELNRRGVAGEAGLLVTDGDIISISKKITMLEMKELNERQRAEHATQLYDKQRNILHDLENRNKELEDKFAEMTKLNLDMQKTERDLRDELSNSVTKSVSDADRKRISFLEETELNLKQEVSKLKEMAEIAATQVRTLTTQQISHEKECQSLRQQLLDFQAQSDEKTVIGKLHRHIVQLQVSEGSAMKRLEEAQSKATKLEAQVLRMEQKVDDKDQTMYHVKQESYSKARYLRKSLQELRIQFAGAVPLARQERFARAMVQLHQDKEKLEVHLKEVQSEREEVEDKLAALTLQQTSLQELIGTLKDGRGAQKIAEWHSKMDAVRLDELKQRRNNSKLQQKIRYLEEVVRSLELSVSEFEADNIRMIKDYEEKQMRWELRETELERTILTMEKQTAEIAGAATKFEQAVGVLPNTKLPVANQLEQAIVTIKGNVKTILDAQAETRVLKERNQELEKQLRDAEKGMIERDKLISELRLRMPASADREDIILQAQARVTQAVKKAETDGTDFESTQALKIAQSTVHSLQQRINQKDETIAKYMQLLQQGRQDMIEMNHRHEEELRAMQQKIHVNTDLAFSKFKDAARELIVKQVSSKSVTAQQLSRLNELEDTVAEQENTIAALHEKVRQKESEVQKLLTSMQVSNNNLQSQHTRFVEEQVEVLGKKETEIDVVKRHNTELQKEVKLLQEEVEALKDVNQRGPSATMKNMVERLKNQLALKEKQQQALSKALSELRADMVMQAKENLQVHAEEAHQDKNIQSLINEHTKQISEQLEEQQTLVERLKKEVKKRKESETSMQAELEDLKEDLNKKDRSVNKLKATKTRLEGEVDELEKKLERMSVARSQKIGEFERQQELDEMRRKCRALEEQLSRNQMAEKPYEQKEEKSKTQESIRWEEGKKWQRTVEKMKNTIREKDIEIDTLNGTISRQKAIMERISKEKDQHIFPQHRAATHAVLGATPSDRLDHDKEDLKSQIYKLQEEVFAAKHQTMTTKEATLKDLQLQNSHLREQLEQLEKAMVLMPGDSSVSASEFQRLFSKNQDLQREVLRLSKENMELRFDVEASRKDVPRLKSRVEDLQSYIEALKFENDQLAGDSARSSMSSIKRIGESGKSQKELERTVALLKKVVERLQADNVALKKAPGVVSQEQLGLLKRENDGLKAQVDELRQHFGQELSDRYTAQQKGTAKMATEFDQMRKELAKERDENEKLRMKIRSLKVQEEHQDKELRTTKSKLELEAAKKLSTTALDSQGWKAAVQTRMYEERIKALELDLDKKTKQLQDNRVLMKDAVEREQALLKEKEDLLFKISVLEQFPAGSGATDGSLMKDYQQCRVKVEMLEKEKRELLSELRHARQQSSSSGTDLLQEDARSRADQYDKVVRENIEVRMELKTCELEKDRMKKEVDRLKKELGSFGPEFFEEIEDLKFSYKQSVQRNVILEDKLKQIQAQLGISVTLPD